ncbi:MAG: 50S ribosomal protein L34e [Nanoarchaeota archaeon]
MVAPKHRTRTFRRRKTLTPGARHVMHYARRKPQHAHCGTCGVVLPAVPRAHPATMKQFPKTGRRPERPFGGVLCSKCTRMHFKNIARSL